MLSLSFVVSWLGSSDQFSAAIFLVSWWVRPGPYKSRLPSWHGPTFVVIIFRAIVIVRQNPKVPVVICTFPLIEVDTGTPSLTYGVLHIPQSSKSGCFEDEMRIFSCY